VIDKKVLKLLGVHLGQLYGPGLGPILPHGAPPSTVAYLGFGKYAMYITSVLAVPGLAASAGDAPARHAKGSWRPRSHEYMEMVALEWAPLPALLDSLGTPGDPRHGAHGHGSHGADAGMHTLRVPRATGIARAVVFMHTHRTVTDSHTCPFAHTHTVGLNGASV
jgi:hypothetical protein